MAQHRKPNRPRDANSLALAAARDGWATTLRYGLLVVLSNQMPLWAALLVSNGVSWWIR